MKKFFSKIFHMARIAGIKYVVVLAIGVVLIGFLGANSLWAHFGNRQRISELQDEIDYYEAEYRKEQAQIKQLKSDPKAMERIARERYFMKAKDEDIFILSDDERVPQLKDPDHATVE